MTEPVADARPVQAIDCRLFAYVNGAPSLGDISQLGWRFEERNGPRDLDTVHPLAVVVHAGAGKSYSEWLNLALTHWNKQPPVHFWIAFTSSNPTDARNSLKEAKAAIGHQMPADAFADFERKIADYVRIFSHPAPTNRDPLGSAKMRIYREALDQFVQWVRSRDRVPRPGESAKLWHPLDEDEINAQQSYVTFVKYALSVCVAHISGAEQASKFFYALFRYHSSPEEIEREFNDFDIELHGLNYPLDLTRKSIRHSWLKHRILGPLKAASNGDAGKREATRTLIADTWPELDHRLKAYIELGHKTAFKDPFRRAAAYLLYKGDIQVRRALDQFLEQEEFPGSPAVLEKIKAVIEREAIDGRYAQALLAIERCAENFGHAVAAGANIAELEHLAAALDEAMESSKIEPAGMT